MTRARLAQIKEADRPEAARAELEQVLPALLERVPARSRYPVSVGRMLREVGGDPVALVADYDGAEAAEEYAALLDGPLYPGGPPPEDLPDRDPDGTAD